MSFRLCTYNVAGMPDYKSSLINQKLQQLSVQEKEILDYKIELKELGKRTDPNALSRKSAIESTLRQIKPSAETLQKVQDALEELYPTAEKSASNLQKYRDLLSKKIDYLLKENPEVFCFQEVSADNKELIDQKMSGYDKFKTARDEVIYVKNEDHALEVKDRDQVIGVEITKNSKRIFVQSLSIAHTDSKTESGPSKFDATLSKADELAKTYDLVVLAGDINADRRMATSGKVREKEYPKGDNFQQERAKALKESKKRNWTTVKASPTEVNPFTSEASQIDTVMMKRKKDGWLLSSLRNIWCLWTNQKMKIGYSVVDIGPTPIKATYQNRQIENFMQYDPDISPSDHRELMVDIHFEAPIFVKKQLKESVQNAFDKDKKLVAKHADKLRPNQLAQIDDLSQVPTETLAKFDEKQIKAIKTETIKKLTPEQLNKLTPSQIYSFTADQWSILRERQELFNREHLETLMVFKDFRDRAFPTLTHLRES